MSNNLEKAIKIETPGLKIKSEPGISSPTRLSSFKPPRDLTLGGIKPIAKKVFHPNLNVVRNKKKTNLTTEVSHERKRDSRGGGARGGRGGNRGAGRGSNILRATGVFSEGVAAGTRHSSSRGYVGDRGTGGGGSGGDMSSLARPTIKVKNDWKVDTDVEEQLIKDLMNDDEEMDTLTDKPLPPTRLPINTFGSMSPMKPETVTNHYPILIKQEVVDIKTEPSSDVQMTEESTKSDHKVKMEYSHTKDTTNLLQTEKPTLLLLQFPDSLPGRGPDEESTEKDKKTDTTEASHKTQHNVCSAKHLSEGQIGKIVIYKSGKIKLLIGNTYYDLSLGTQACFRQDVMSISVNPEERSGTMINLGSIQSKLTATPLWEMMFQQMQAK